ncbi:MAG: hypothetical protein ACR2RB_11735 [Gammaproteobacteria bacterium]
MMTRQAAARVWPAALALTLIVVTAVVVIAAILAALLDLTLAQATVAVVTLLGALGLVLGLMMVALALAQMAEEAAATHRREVLRETVAKAPTVAVDPVRTRGGKRADAATVNGEKATMESRRESAEERDVIAVATVMAATSTSEADQ